MDGYWTRRCGTALAIVGGFLWLAASAAASPVEADRTAARDPARGRSAALRAEKAVSGRVPCPARCLRPWSLPDRWYDADGSETFNPDPVVNPNEFYDPDATGYQAPADVGLQLTLCLGNPSQTDFRQLSYYPVMYPPLNKGGPVGGAYRYHAWILGCVDSSFSVEAADTLVLEPGNMVGPTIAGVETLIASDPGAHWDEGANEVVGSAYPVSPRIVKVTLFDPETGIICPGAGAAVVAARIVSIFVEGLLGPDLTVRFVDEVCDGETSVEGSSWGGVKSRFR
ncbi:MAG: hypothetical protein ABIH26_13110 [Candidatus Eisenbacteria bacterium]